MKTSRFQRIIQIIALIGVAMTLVVIAFQIFRGIYGPNQKAILNTMRTEFNRINKLPSASVIDERYTAFIDKTHVDVTYSTYLGDDEIQRYYNAELLRNGWQLVEKKGSMIGAETWAEKYSLTPN